MGLLSTIGAASGRAFGLTRVGAAIRDAYFNLTTLLLPGNGTNGAQNNTFLDSSTNNFTITRNGNTTQGTFSPFSQTGWSNNFVRASSQYLTVSNASGDFNFGTGAFTIECWVNLASMPSGSGYPASYWLFGGGPMNNDPGIDLYITNTQIGFNLVNFVTPTAIGNHGMSVGNWYHIVAVRGGTSNQTLSLYVNGTRVATATSVTATAATTSDIAISAAEPAGSTGGNLDGYISNYRIVKGTAVYDPTASTLTVPTAPLTAITNTVLLTCQGNRFFDANTQVTAKTINIVGSPSVQAFSPFAPTAAYSASTNGGSGYFDGTGDYLSIAGSSSFSFTGDFTVEGWFYNTSQPQYVGICSIGAYTDGIMIRVESNGSAPWWLTPFVNGSSPAYSSTRDIKINTWYHMALVRSGTTVTFYINGKSVSTFTVSGTVNTTNGGVNIGSNDLSQPWNGYLSGFRIVKGTAVYTADFTVPTAPPTAVTNTLLLTNFTNAGITDATAKNDLETVGNAQISTTQSKFGGSSMYFDGNDKVVLPYTQNFNLGTTYTIEAWIYPTTVTGYQRIFDIVNSATSAPAFLDIALNGTALVSELRTTNGGTATTISGGTVSANTWSHVAVSVNSGSARLFLNGTQVGSTTTFSALPDQNFVGIGGIGNSLTIDYFTGYIDDLRITKGLARYTGNFTPPTAAFALQ